MPLVSGPDNAREVSQALTRLEAQKCTSGPQNRKYDGKSEGQSR
jgi:hypothetical protein